jgi:hypothetical protein
MKSLQSVTKNHKTIITKIVLLIRHTARIIKIHQSQIHEGCDVTNISCNASEFEWRFKHLSDMSVRKVHMRFGEYTVLLQISS